MARRMLGIFSSIEVNDSIKEAAKDACGATRDRPIPRPPSEMSSFLSFSYFTGPVKSLQ